MKYKVEIGFIDEKDEKKNVFVESFVEAESESEAIELARTDQIRKRPDLKITDRWFFSVFRTNENSNI